MSLMAVPTPVTSFASMPLPAFLIAFQPIVHVEAQRVVAYEALTRGQDGTAYPQLVEGMDAPTLHRFHRRTATEAIRRAVALGIKDLNASLCLNLEPDLHPEALDAEFLREAADDCGLDPSAILLELTENCRLGSSDLNELLARNHAAGFSTGVDDFGAGYSGLSMLVECHPEVLKLDRELVRGIDTSDRRQKIVAAFAAICASLNMSMVAEGVETPEECAMLRSLGVTLMQGFLFSRPMLDVLPCGDIWGVTDSAETRSAGQGTIAGWMDESDALDSVDLDSDDLDSDDLDSDDLDFELAGATLPA